MFNVLSWDTRGAQEHARSQIQALWEPGKHNARHGFLNRSRSICTVISVVRQRAHSLTYVYMYAPRTGVHLWCTSCAKKTRIDIQSIDEGKGEDGPSKTGRAREAAPKPKWIGAKDEAGEREGEPCAGEPSKKSTCEIHITSIYIRVSRICFSCPAPAHGSSPHSTGQWLAGSVSLQSTPIQPSPVPFADQFALSPSPSACPPFLRVQCFTSLRSFVLLLPRAPRRGVSETSMRDSSSFLISLSHSLPLSFSPSLFPFTLPFPPPPRRDTRALLSFPRLVPSSFPIRRVSTVNRYFRSDAFRLSITVSDFLSLSLFRIKLTCDFAKFLPISFFTSRKWNV